MVNEGVSSKSIGQRNWLDRLLLSNWKKSLLRLLEKLLLLGLEYWLLRLECRLLRLEVLELLLTNYRLYWSSNWGYCWDRSRKRLRLWSYNGLRFTLSGRAFAFDNSYSTSPVFDERFGRITSAGSGSFVQDWSWS